MQQNLLIIVCIFIICIDPKIDFLRVSVGRSVSVGRGRLAPRFDIKRRRGAFFVDQHSTHGYATKVAYFCIIYKTASKKFRNRSIDLVGSEPPTTIDAPRSASQDQSKLVWSYRGVASLLMHSYNGKFGWFLIFYRFMQK